MDQQRDYRGPYFRTGVDGLGNCWELDNSTAKTESKRLQRKPTKWELQRPKRNAANFTDDFSDSNSREALNPSKTIINATNLKWGLKPYLSVESFAQEIPSYTNLKKRENEKPARTVEQFTQNTPSPLGEPQRAEAQMNNKEWIDDWASGEERPFASERGLKKHGGEVFISKEYLKDMLLEIWKESSPIHPPKGLNSRKPADGESKSEKPEVKASKTKIAVSTTSSASAVQGKAAKVNPASSQSVPGPWREKSYISAREEKLRMFELFEKMSCEPPASPPDLRTHLSAASFASSTGGGKKKLVKKKTKKSPAAVSQPAFPSFDPVYQIHPSQVQYYAQPHQVYQAGMGMGLPPKSPRKARNTSRITQSQSRHDGINSTLVVQKVPLVDGWFNDAMLPPMVHPSRGIKKKSSVKSRFDTYGPLSWSSAPQFAYNVDPLRGRVPSAPEETLSVPTRKIKSKVKNINTTDAYTTNSKPKRMNKDFQNMFVGPYVDSELDLLQQFKVRPKP